MSDPVPFIEALKQLRARGLLPTSWDTARLRELDAAVRRQSFFSAQTTETGLLAEYKGIIENIVEPGTEQRADRETASNPSGFTTTGFNPATARAHIKDFLDRIGYQPEKGKAGTLLDLSSDKRVDLVVKTNVQLSHGAGRFIQENADPDVVDLFPALELVRFEDRKEPRDWEQRWRIASSTVGDVDAARCLGLQGRMCALKSSEIWQALGDGAGGYQDTLGNPYPPFAFNSGMWTEEVSRDEAEDLGLLGKGEKAEPAAFSLASLFSKAA
jgi:hypothetical protein